MLTVILPAALLAASALPVVSTLPAATEAPGVAVTGERLSSGEIGSVLGASSTLPPNCWVREVNGTCFGIICVEGGVWVLYECDYRPPG